jgi:protoporphyrinogen oxidase
LNEANLAHMKNPRTVAIAGAGIAGMTAAYFEAVKGHQVYLIEPAKRPGGLLQTDITPFGSFDYGTHVGTFSGIEMLDDFLFGGATRENFCFFNPGLSGNFYAGTLSEIGPFVDTRLMDDKLRQKAELELLNPSLSSGATNLEELITERFGPTIYREVFSSVVQKFMGCDAAILSAEMINLFDMNRILAFDSGTSERLKTDERYDTSLGYHYPHPGSQKIYPRTGGMGYWIEFLMAKLAQVGVTFLGYTKIENISHSGGQVTHLDVGDKTLQVDELIWSVAPALFSKHVSFSASFPSPKFRKTALYDFSFQKPFSTKCYYINVYDSAKISGRITLYPNLTPESEYHSCTVEVLAGDDFGFENATESIYDELRSMGIVDSDNPCVHQFTRAVGHGFPLPELNYTAQTVTQSAAMDAKFSNVLFIGRAPGRFFMKDVLTHVYQSLFQGRTSDS